MKAPHFLLPGALTLLAATGCETPATYVESNSPQTIVSLDKINTQDWANAADQMIASLLSSGVLEESPRQPAVMAVSTIVNNTTQLVDINLLTKKIRVALNRSGKVRTLTTLGPGGTVEDGLAKSTAEMKDYLSATGGTPLPDYTLSGRIIEDRASAGSIKQVAYVFQLSLTETNTGLAVWEDEVTITKQGERAAVGW